MNHDQCGGTVGTRVKKRNIASPSDAFYPHTMITKMMINVMVAMMMDHWQHHLHNWPDHRYHHLDTIIAMSIIAPIIAQIKTCIWILSILIQTCRQQTLIKEAEETQLHRATFVWLFTSECFQIMITLVTFVCLNIEPVVSATDCAQRRDPVHYYTVAH